MRQYRLEPVINLEDGQHGWAELLFGPARGTPLPRTRDSWREWYATLPSLVEDALANSSYCMIAVNVDSVHLLDRPTRCSLDQLRGLPVMIEWTERRDLRIARPEVDAVGDILATLATCHGFKVALDDMGAGEDAMTRLVALMRGCKPDVIKIDGPFFQSCRGRAGVEEVLLRYVAMFRDLGIPSCIEWIETSEDLALAARLGAEWGQGFFWNLSPFATHDDALVIGGAHE